MSDRAGRIAVVLLNLGGPGSLDEVRPFLESLFGDPAILPFPQWIRFPAAAAIARVRAPVARRSYARMGGASPLLAGTLAQAEALERKLAGSLAPAEVRVFVAMRHAQPTSPVTAAQVAAFSPDEIVLAPLYPQFSTTTTASSVQAWRKAYSGLQSTRVICCWWGVGGLIESHAKAIDRTWEAAGRPAVRLLFSAHGLPIQVVARGDPYQWQVEQTCKEVASRLNGRFEVRICYQSRVGPMKWLGPSVVEEIAAAAAAGVGVLIDPISFVSEHVETLVELDHDYRILAERLGCPVYLRAPAPGTDGDFLGGLAAAVEAALARSWDGPEGACCPAGFARCGRDKAGAATHCV